MWSEMAIAGAVVLMVAVALGLALRRLAPSGGPCPDADRIREFSIASYRPMERLLAKEDLCFLETQPGYQPALARQLFRERRRIFRLYLRHLSSDFQQLHRVARLLVAHGPEDRPDLAKALVRTSLTFWWQMAGVEVRLALHALPVVPPATVDVRGLLDATAWMHEQIGLFVQPRAPQITAA
jgi:hypothetical protein